MADGNGWATAAACACIMATVAGCLAGNPDAGDPPAEPPGAVGSEDPLLDLQWGLSMARVPDAWAFATGRNITIAIIDTGVDLSHPDLRSKLVLHDGAVFAGDTLQDDVGHGTGVAGIAAAETENGMGIAGVARDARIMPVRLFTIGFADEVVAPGFFDRLAAAIRFAVDHGAVVINMSFGVNVAEGSLPLTAPQVDEAIAYAWEKGAVLVGAAGNYALPQCNDPAGHPDMLCVASVGSDGSRAPYSNVAPDQDFVSAPGGDAFVPGMCAGGVISTQPNATSDFCPTEDGGAMYAYNFGTSYASPFVAGVAALLFELGLTNEEVVQRIKATAVPAAPSGVPSLVDAALHGHGRVDALCSVTDGQASDCV